MERGLYFKLRYAFQQYLSTVFDGKFEPRMVEDLLGIVQEAEKESA